MMDIRRLDAELARKYKVALGKVLLECVQAGASVSFMASLTQEEAETFFHRVADKVESGECILLAAFVNAELVGTVQVLIAMPPNQPHRADVAKLLVRPMERGKGIAEELMKQAEEVSRLAGKSLLVLDTASEIAERLYLRLGWTRVGVIPRYALLPDGNWCDTTIFWKWIA